MPDSCRSCCHSRGRPVNSPVLALNPTWVRCTGSYGVLISGRFDVFMKDMKERIFPPFFVAPLLPPLLVPELPLVALDIVPARDRGVNVCSGATMSMWPGGEMGSP